MDEYDSYLSPKEGKIYISPPFKNSYDPDRKIRLVSKVINSPDSYAFGTVKKEVVLRHKKDAATNIKATLVEGNNSLIVLNIQGYTVATDKPYNASFSFVGAEIKYLYDFLHNIQYLNFEGYVSSSMSDKDLRGVAASQSQINNASKIDPDLIQEILKTNVTKDDVVAIGYRKSQLTVFKNLLTDSKFFSKLMSKKNTTKEGLWQAFFEKNPWIFGYGLSYLFTSNLDDKKLEQVVQGFNVMVRGKCVDGFLKTKGIISNSCFVEIKTHETLLLQNVKTPYRADCWSASSELVGGISQIQGTVAAALDSIGNKFEGKDQLGNPTSEEVFNYQPKSFLIVGNLREFYTENGVNEDKYRSFELFRKNINNPEIITFDELYERAKFIIHQNEK